MEAQTFLDDSTHILQNVEASLAAATTVAEHAQAAYDALENIRQLANQANEGGPQVGDFAGVPQ